MATLKISDLSVGDWVYHDDIVFGREIAKVHRLNKDKNGETIGITVYRSDGAFGVVGYIWTSPTHGDLHPIPITAEILEKNGWWRLGHQCVWNIEDNQGTSHDGEYVITWDADDEYLTISWGGREDEVLVERTIIECRVKYIHDLHHALRLAGVDKEITL